MAEEAVKLFTVTDEKGTKLVPMEADYEVTYKYTNEEAVKVLEGEVKRGEGIAPTGVTKFPDKDAAKELERSDIKVTPKGPTGWDAYVERDKSFAGKIPEKGDKVELPKTKSGKRTKKEIKEGSDDAVSKKIEIIKSKQK